MAARVAAGRRRKKANAVHWTLKRDPKQVFSLPGVGRQFVFAALQRDYTVVMGVVILYASLIILLNLIADLLYAVLNPKVKFD